MSLRESLSSGIWTAIGSRLTSQPLLITAHLEGKLQFSRGKMQTVCVLAVKAKVLRYRLVGRLGLLVTRTRTVNSTAALYQLSHVGAVVQFRPGFGASGRVGRVAAGVFFGSVCAAGDL